VRHFLILDGGGTKTAIKLYRGSSHGLKEVADFQAPATNPHALGLDRSLEVLSQALQDLPHLGHELSVFAGIAGCGNPHFHTPVHAWFVRRFPGALISLMSDVELLLDHATPPHSRWVLIAGTGSVSMARDDRGNLHRAGGWGHLLGDEGGAYWVGLHGIRAAICAIERRADPSSLSEAILKHFGAESISTLAARIHGFSPERTQIAEAARVVLKECAAGDRVADIITDQAADHLLRLASAIYMSLSAAQGDSRALPEITLAGSLLIKGDILRDRFCKRLAASFPKLTISMVEDVPTTVSRHLDQS
jgi:N-acetylglucosamine kinase-like BadF-type ATPase